MKLLLVLVCLLLCGCSKEMPEVETEIPSVAATAPAETIPVRMYEAGNPLEAEYQGGLKVYPLTMRKVRGIRYMEDRLLVFSGYGSTTLSVLTGEDLLLDAQTTLDFELDPNDPSLRISGGLLSYYDPARQQTIVLNGQLKEVSRIKLPEPISGSPILSADRNTLYYSTSNAVRAWDLETDIHRTIKELSYSEQTLTGLHLDDTVLQCRIRDGETVQTLFLSTQTGQLLSCQEGDVSLTVRGERYFASLPVSALEMLVFGEISGAPQVLYPEAPANRYFYLPESHAAVTASMEANDCVTLHYYDLSTGLCRAKLTLDALQSPKSVEDGPDGTVSILTYDPARDCDIVYRWDPTAAVFAPKAVQHSTQPYAGTESQDLEALAQCQAQAAQLSEKYGIQIHVWENALAVQPWDYEFEAESLPPVLWQELELLDQRLGQYPTAVLEKTVSHFSSLHICLVRQITGTAASGSLDTATGIQFLEGTDAYVVIAVGKYAQQALYHELFHVMETHIINESVALDQWNDLNPDGFQYTYGYDAPANAAQYLSGQERAFVDQYSMSFPKEDRARVWENAMLPGNAELFTAPVLQAKLTALCQGVRKAYGLRKSPDTFLWEQYLDIPLAYTE